MNGFSPNERLSDRTTPAAQSNPGPSRGTLVVLGFLVLAAALGAFAVWFQWEQTRRCLAFFGPEVAAAIQSSPTVELWEHTPGAESGRNVRVLDVSGAPGLVHLRRGLIEDVNYAWGAEPAAPTEDPIPSGPSTVIFAFSDPSSTTKKQVTLAIDLDAGSLCVVGRPGSVTLGRLRSGLAKWVDETRSSRISGEKSGY